MRNDNTEYEVTDANDRQRRNQELEEKKRKTSKEMLNNLEVERQRLIEIKKITLQKMEKNKNYCQAEEEEILRIKFEERKQNLMQRASGANQSASAHKARGRPHKFLLAAIGPPLHALLPLPPLRISRPRLPTTISSQGSVERSSLQMQRTRGLLVVEDSDRDLVLEDLERNLHLRIVPSACDSG